MSFAMPYARAFLETAPKGYDVEAFLASAGDLARAIEKDPALRAFLAAPAVPDEAKRKAVAELAARAGIDPFGARFLELLLKHRRILATGVDPAGSAQELRRFARDARGQRHRRRSDRGRRTGDDRAGSRREAERPGASEGGGRSEDPGRFRGARGLERFRRLRRGRNPPFPGASERNGSLRWRSKRTRSRQSSSSSSPVTRRRSTWPRSARSSRSATASPASTASTRSWRASSWTSATTCSAWRSTSSRTRSASCSWASRSTSRKARKSGAPGASSRCPWGRRSSAASWTPSGGRSTTRDRSKPPSLIRSSASRRA